MSSSPSLSTFSIRNNQDKVINLSRSEDNLVIHEQGKRAVECPINQVLWSEVLKNNTLAVSFLRKQGKRWVLHRLEGAFPVKDHDEVREWSNGLLEAAYQGSQPKRKFKVFINPFGGPGKAMRIFDQKIKPIFEAANCQFDVLVSERRWHCFEYVKSMALEYDALVVLSGDGLIHEIFNAFAAREDASTAFTIPVVQIPTGSGNGFSISLLGPEDGLDVLAAALNAIKGKHMKIDLCAMKQNGKESISFMSQSIGMMADVDLGTEYMRWMGDTRFMVGFFLAVCAYRDCPMKLEIKVASKDKQHMFAAYRDSHLRSQQLDSNASTTSSLVGSEDDEWIVFDKRLAYVCAGKLPYLSRDLMQFPVALCDDGLIDIVAQEKVSRGTFIKGIDGAKKGKPFWEPSTHYFKAKAYRLTPSALEGCFSVDGERFPYTTFEVEIRERLGTTLGKGGWSSDFSG